MWNSTLCSLETKEIVIRNSQKWKEGSDAKIKSDHWTQFEDKNMNTFTNFNVYSICVLKVSCARMQC